MPLQSLGPTRDDVLHKSKRAAAPSPQVAELIARLLGTPNDDLSRVLAEIDAWKWPRSDLNAWIKVLNKFDAIMEEIIRDYQVDTPTPSQRLHPRNQSNFVQNPQMFYSYDRLNSLLFTPDLDVLILALNLLLRPSQQYSAQPSVSHALNISTPRLQSLAKRWPHMREYGVSLARFGDFYPTNEDARSDQDKMDTDTEPQSSQRTTATTSSNAVSIHVDPATLDSKSEVDVLADIVEEYAVPEADKFELLCRIRAALVLKRGNEAEREKLVVVRLLAVAIFGHTHPEPQAATSLFLYEPDVINHIAELLQTDKEVLTAVNAGVNHGLLMSMIRKTVADVTNPESTLPHSFTEALWSFLTYIAAHASGGNMIVGAGLIPLLIQLIENNFTNAFSLFCAARGVEALVQRIEDLKEFGNKQRAQEVHVGHMELPVARAALLKHVLRSIHRMMQSSGTAEGLRGLIDMSILASLKKIIKYRGLLGPTVVPLAINIVATFIHNEPTSLAIIQEAGLLEVFFKTIEVGLEPSIEVIQAIPNAIGALCLNEAGVAQLQAHPSVIPAIFSIFSSEQHLKLLLDKENAVLIGTTIDELIRHHPFLNGQVFEAIKATLGKPEILCKAFIAPVQIQRWYKLVDLEVTSEGDVPMAAADAPNVPATTDAPRDDAVAPAAEEGPTKTTDDNNIASFVDVLLRFLECLFQHTPHCKDFTTSADGLERLGRITNPPCIPYDFANSVASDSLVQVMRTMAEVTTLETLAHLSKLVKESLEATKDFWETLKGAQSCCLLSILLLIHLLISSKPMFESGQTLLIVTRVKKVTAPGDVEPHNFLINLHFAALPTVLELTNGDGEWPSRILRPRVLRGRLPSTRPASSSSQTWVSRTPRQNAPLPHQQQAVRNLVDDIEDFSPFTYDVQEQPLANRTELRANLMECLLALLLSNPVSIDPEHPSIPKWLAAHLLVTEALFTLADEPRSISAPKEGESVASEALSEGPALSDARMIVFNFYLRLLAIPDLPNDELLSTLRFLFKGTGLRRRLKTSSVTGSSSYIATILRHIVEDDTTVHTIMKQAIKCYFAQPANEWCRHEHPRPQLQRDGAPRPQSVLDRDRLKLNAQPAEEQPAGKTEMQVVALVSGNESLSRAVEELPANDNVETRYGRLLAFADLCYRLLTVRFSTSTRKAHDETPTHLAKVMLEKNFVATLTSALSEVDLNYPNVRGLVGSILRPLEFLTKVAIKMSRSTKNKEIAEGDKADDSASSNTSAEEEDADEMEESDHEETPDVYRTSALGMFVGEMDTGGGAEDEMDEDEEDEDEDVEMDFGETPAGEWSDWTIVEYMVEKVFTIPSRAVDNKQTSNPLDASAEMESADVLLRRQTLRDLRVQQLIDDAFGQEVIGLAAEEDCHSDDELEEQTELLVIQKKEGRDPLGMRAGR
ncbi:hypothetical protein MKEN_01083200 [Mycena kentingensis (nom. inval.)]|nr:hypothetical protein MKEN_01083200 [Mycena kentingensis (nom. inval.)]